MGSGMKGCTCMQQNTFHFMSMLKSEELFFSEAMVLVIRDAQLDLWPYWIFRYFYISQLLSDADIDTYTYCIFFNIIAEKIKGREI